MSNTCSHMGRTELGVNSLTRRGVAQSGSASGWGPEGRWFKSSRPDSSAALAFARCGSGQTARSSVIDNGLAMACDENLAELVRELLADEPDLTEKRMFGGLAFLAYARSLPPKG